MKYIFLMFIVFHFSCKEAKVETVKIPQLEEEIGKGIRTIPRIKNEIKVDGEIGADEWPINKPYFFDNVWIGDNLEPVDFKGRYQLAYNENYLYVGAQIYDDTLVDIHKDGLVQYWDDDCLEIFIDEDNSKGDHKYNHNAFAYHIALDGKVVDLGTDSLPHYYDHVIATHKSYGKYTFWEIAIPLFDDSFKDGGNNKPLTLEKGKKLGFMIAYCDNDYSETREHFIGSEHIDGEDKNKGWIDAGVFGEYILE